MIFMMTKELGEDQDVIQIHDHKMISEISQEFVTRS